MLSIIIIGFLAYSLYMNYKKKYGFLNDNIEIHDIIETHDTDVTDVTDVRDATDITDYVLLDIYEYTGGEKDHKFE